MVKVLALTFNLLLAGCVTGNFCDVANGPHRHSGKTVDVMTDAEVTQELEYNNTGAELCGWEP